MALAGEIEMFAEGAPGAPDLSEVGVRLEVPSPQPDCQKTRLATANAESQLTPILLQSLAVSGREDKFTIMLLSSSSRSGMCQGAVCLLPCENQCEDCMCGENGAMVREWRANEMILTS